MVYCVPVFFLVVALGFEVRLYLIICVGADSGCVLAVAGPLPEFGGGDLWLGSTSVCDARL